MPATEIKMNSAYRVIDRSKKNKTENDENQVKLGTREQDNSEIRLLGSWGPGEWKQTDPPTIPVSQQFEKGKFPIGEIQEYGGDSNR